jgi:hypothetical protein
MLKVPPSPVLHPSTPSSFVNVQKVPLGTRSPGSAGEPGVPFTGVGDAMMEDASAKMVRIVAEARMFAVGVRVGCSDCWLGDLTAGVDFSLNSLVWLRSEDVFDA